MQVKSHTVGQLRVLLLSLPSTHWIEYNGQQSSPPQHDMHEPPLLQLAVPLPLLSVLQLRYSA